MKNTSWDFTQGREALYHVTDDFMILSFSEENMNLILRFSRKKNIAFN